MDAQDRIALKQTICKAEFEARKEAYKRMPHTDADADDWSDAEEFVLGPHKS